MFFSVFGSTTSSVVDVEEDGPQRHSRTLHLGARDAGQRRKDVHHQAIFGHGGCLREGFRGGTLVERVRSQALVGVAREAASAEAPANTAAAGVGSIVIV